jgi:N-formylglutamate amidohydrolase
MTDFASFTETDLQFVSTAIHAGHDLRPNLEARIALDEATRFREEDPFTDRLIAPGGGSVVVHRSRFEVDLNRPRDGAVYRSSEDAWGLDVWAGELPDAEIAESLRHNGDFYATLGGRLDELAARGRFVVLDLHSYNHRRDGADATPGPESANPEINVGTESVDRDEWGQLGSEFMRALGKCQVRGDRLDVRENVRFRGGHLSRWINERYRGIGCSLAVEFKKVFMDEWTGVVDDEHLRQLLAALEQVVPTLLDSSGDRARG